MLVPQHWRLHLVPRARRGGGRLIPPEEQYASYAAALERVGCAVRLYADGGTARATCRQAPKPSSDELARALTSDVERPAAQLIDWRLSSHPHVDPLTPAAAISALGPTA